jgi:uncharacterized repeat protein (TIGR03803 family)
MIFKITEAGVFSTIHSFEGSDGAYPYAALMQASNGLLYGSTTGGGKYGYGTIFSITPGGALTSLAAFNVTDGAGPEASLVQATDGNLYGTTDYGGFKGAGVIFQMTLVGALNTYRWADAGYQWNSLRDNLRRRSRQRWHAL